MAVKTPKKPITADEQEKGTMQVQRQFDSITAHKLESMPIEEIRKRLGIEEQKTSSQPSQADLILQDVQNPKYSLKGVQEDVIKSVKEFRDNFHFEHDK